MIGGAFQRDPGFHEAALIVSQFTGFLALVRQRLDAQAIDYCYLDGRTRNRDRVLTSFKQGDAPVFLISLKAGGTGLNLTEADYVFVLDPWWNPAVEPQAVDRSHRTRQTNPGPGDRPAPGTAGQSAKRTAAGKRAKEIIRCLCRCTAREVFTAITSPPTALPNGHQLRALRNDRGLSLTAVSAEFGTTPINISRIERGLTHDTRLARRIRDWLLKDAH